MRTINRILSIVECDNAGYRNLDPIADGKESIRISQYELMAFSFFMYPIRQYLRSRAAIIYCEL
jgi:hypothetical protein